MASRSVRSSVASVVEWKCAGVSTTITSYDSRATSSSRASFDNPTTRSTGGKHRASSQAWYVIDTFSVPEISPVISTRPP